MKLATYSADGRTRTGIVVGDQIVDTGYDGTMIDLIRDWDAMKDDLAAKAAAGGDCLVERGLVREGLENRIQIDSRLQIRLQPGPVALRLERDCLDGSRDSGHRFQPDPAAENHRFPALTHGLPAEGLAAGQGRGEVVVDDRHPMPKLSGDHGRQTVGSGDGDVRAP